jgi:hypothetical protein
MSHIDEVRDTLAQKLSEQYAQNILDLEEYERILQYLQSIETKKEIAIIESIIQRNGLIGDQNDEILPPLTKEKHCSVFSWNTSHLKPVRGNGGNYTSCFGTTRIIVDHLPPGRTIVHINAVFGLTEIVIRKNIKITNKISPLFSGIFFPNETGGEGETLPELYIIGKALFSNIRVKTIEAVKHEEAYTRRYEEKVLRKILDQ